MMDIQVDHSHYQQADYNERGRFSSYWHQVDAARSLYPANILEIGTGNGFVNFILKKFGYKVTSVDIDDELQPDIKASVLSLPIPDNTFDMAMCCQVLEHLPYEDFVPALKEIRRVIKKNLVLSLPDLHRVYRFDVQLPAVGSIRFLYKIPRLRPLPWEFNGEHYWNISCAGYPLKRIRNDIQSAGYTIERIFCVFELPWHRFFILTKQ